MLFRSYVTAGGGGAGTYNGLHGATLNASYPASGGSAGAMTGTYALAYTNAGGSGVVNFDACYSPSGYSGSGGSIGISGIAFGFVGYGGGGFGYPAISNGTSPTQGYGCGGGGAVNFQNSSGYSGGSGRAGILIVEW